MQIPYSFSTVVIVIHSVTSLLQIELPWHHMPGLVPFCSIYEGPNHPWRYQHLDSFQFVDKSHQFHANLRLQTVARSRLQKAYTMGSSTVKRPTRALYLTLATSNQSKSYKIFLQPSRFDLGIRSSRKLNAFQAALHIAQAGPTLPDTSASDIFHDTMDVPSCYNTGLSIMSETIL